MFLKKQSFFVGIFFEKYIYSLASVKPIYDMTWSFISLTKYVQVLIKLSVVIKSRYYYI